MNSMMLNCPHCGQPYEPGEPVCTNCGMVFDDDTGAIEPFNHNLVCPNCGKDLQPEVQVCLNCGIILDDSLKPRQQDDTFNFANAVSEAEQNSPWAMGEITLGNQRALSFEVDGMHLTLPDGEKLVIGRYGNVASELQPDVDLSIFGAHEKGVSRRHICIKRQGTLVYVADIGSANGTWLNGHRLIENGERVLRDGDELILSHLKIKVKYHVPSTDPV
jgi:predicted nucleic acid-binding Zn ribbon protein